MKSTQILSTVCLTGLLACGTASVQQPASKQAQVLTMYQGGTYTRQVGKRLLDGNQLGEWAEVQVLKVDCSGNDVLLVWGKATVRFPGVWPANEALVVNGTFENPPLRLTFPASLDGDAKPVRDVVWSSEKLIVDGSLYDLVPGDSYVFTEGGLEALSSDAADTR